jgi:DNA-binding PadR family transcriptional regulator
VGGVATRRRVGNLMALAVLSVLVQRPMHPYEMASVLRERNKDEDMKIKWGSLYTVVANLEKHNLIEAAESTRQGGRPERTVYRITADGHAELVDWVRELVSTPQREQSRFAAGLSVLAVLDPAEVTELLRQRLDRLSTRIDAQREALALAGLEIPRLFLVESEYELAILDAEAAWLRSLVREFTAGSFPGLEQWQAFHRTGELPAELAEIAERGSTQD